MMEQKRIIIIIKRKLLIIDRYYINFMSYKKIEFKGVRMKYAKLIIISILLTAFLFSNIALGSPYTTAAKMAIQLKDYKKALELLKKEIANDPESNEGYYLMGFVYGKLNKIDEMLDAYNKSLAIDDEYEKEITADKFNTWAIFFNKGVKYFQKGNKPNERLMGENSSTVINWLGQPDKIVESRYENISTKMYIYNNFNLNIYFDKDKAVGYTQISDAQTTSMDSSLGLGTTYYYEISAESFKTAVKIEPDSIDTHRNLAFVLLNAQRYDEAIEPLQTIIDKRNSKDGYRFLGNIYYNKAKTLQSKFISTKNSEDSVAYIKMYDKAIEILEAGKKAFPSDSNILLALSNSYIGANKTDVAINAFKEGVERQPDNKYYHYNYGVLLLGSKKYVEAIEQFKAAEKIDANYENAIYNLGVVYVQWGDEIRKSEQDQEVQTDKFKAKYEAALPYLEKVIQLNDKEAAIWETLGKVYTRLGKTSDAENAFNKSDSLR